MQYGLDIPTSGEYADPRKLAELAADAEAAGWDGFFIWDVMFAEGDSTAPVLDATVALAAIAMQTTRIKIGAMLTPLPRRRPWKVAREMASLDLLSNGRLVFGVGLGGLDRDFTTFGESYDTRLRAEKVDEGLEIITGLWRGEPYSFKGHHYSVEDATFLPRPLQAPRIPIWTAAGWPKLKPLRRAARWDGVYLMTVNQETNELLTPDEIRQVADYVRAQRDSPAPFDIGMNGVTPNDAARGAAIVQPYAEAGVTWWVEYAADRASFAAYRERIMAGPPKV